MIIGTTIKVVIGGEVHGAEMSARAIVDLERHFGAGVVELFAGDGARMEALYFAAWRSLQLTGDYQGDFESFLDVVELVEPFDEPLAPFPPPPSR